MGLIVAGMHSSGGKTAVTSLLLAALRIRDFIVQPFKVGPDYIDPGFHFHYSAKHSINLDPWIMGREHILQTAKEFTEQDWELYVDKSQAVPIQVDTTFVYNDLQKFPFTTTLQGSCIL